MVLRTKRLTTLARVFFSIVLQSGVLLSSAHALSPERGDFIRAVSDSTELVGPATATGSTDAIRKQSQRARNHAAITNSKPKIQTKRHSPTKRPPPGWRPTKTPTPTKKPPPTKKPIETPTKTPTKIPVASPTAVVLATASNTEIPVTDSPVNTPAPDPTDVTPSDPTNTPVPWATATALVTAINTEIPITYPPVNTPAPDPTDVTPSNPTNTPVPWATATALVEATNTELPVTYPPVNNSPVNTAAPDPTKVVFIAPTDTPVQSATPTAVAVATDTETPVDTTSPDPTETPLATATDEALESATPTTIVTAVVTYPPVTYPPVTYPPVNTTSPNPTVGVPFNPTDTPSESAAMTPTVTSAETDSAVDTVSPDPTETPLAIATDEALESETPSTIVTAVQTDSPVDTVTPGPTETPLATSTEEALESATPTPSVTPTDTEPPVDTASPDPTETDAPSDTATPDDEVCEMSTEQEGEIDEAAKQCNEAQAALADWEKLYDEAVQGGSDGVCATSDLDAIEQCVETFEGSFSDSEPGSTPMTEDESAINGDESDDESFVSALLLPPTTQPTKTMSLKVYTDPSRCPPCRTELLELWKGTGHSPAELQPLLSSKRYNEATQKVTSALVDAFKAKGITLDVQVSKSGSPSGSIPYMSLDGTGKDASSLLAVLSAKDSPTAPPPQKPTQQCYVPKDIYELRSICARAVGCDPKDGLPEYFKASNYTMRRNTTQWHCQHYANLFASVCKANFIPYRQCRVPGHTLNVVYLKDTGKGRPGWICIEPQGLRPKPGKFPIPVMDENGNFEPIDFKDLPKYWPKIQCVVGEPPKK